jgi:hypothetical protein
VRVAILVIALLTGLECAAHEAADGDIYASLGIFNYMTHALNHSMPNPVLQGPAFKAEADLSKHGGIEVSVFYLRNSFSIKQNRLIVIERIKRLYIASGYRHWFNDRFSMALALSSSYSMGDLQIVRDDFRGGARQNTSASDTTEYGFDLSVQYEAWRHDRFSVVIDGRYDWSVTAKPSEDSNHFGALVALKYFVQSRERSP